MSEESRNGHRVINGCEILDNQWITLNSGECFGVVLVDNGHERKVYCGIGQGHSEPEDTKYIVEHGSKMHPEMWVPFLSKAWKYRIDKYCSKCGAELDPESPEACVRCGSLAGERSNDDDMYRDDRRVCD